MQAISKCERPAFLMLQKAVILGCCIIVLTALAAYSNSFSGPFVYDDTPAIAENLALRHFWPAIHSALAPPEGGMTLAGRPALSLSLALNYALGGLDVRGYHV